MIALIIDEKEEVFKGICKGEITKELTGEGGFGYDPIFQPEKMGITFAQMSVNEKTKISHRGKAISLLISYLSQ